MKKGHLSDKEMEKRLNIDSKTLARFKEIQRRTIAEAKKLAVRKGKIKVLGISGSARDEFDTSQENSSSEELLKVCLNECKKLGAETELVPLRKYNIKPCKACYSTANTQCHFYCSCYSKGSPQEDDMTKMIYDKILEADVLILATPVNNFSMSTHMKTFVDRCISLDGSLMPANPKSPKDKELNIKHMKFIEMNADEGIAGSGMLRRFSGKTGGIIVTGHEEGATMVISSLFMTFNHFGVLFPPFSNMYAMSSYCTSTYNDKPIVLSDCYIEDAKLLANNLINAAKIARSTKTTSWKSDYRMN